MDEIHFAFPYQELKKRRFLYFILYLYYVYCYLRNHDLKIDYLQRNQQEIRSPLISFIDCCHYGGSYAKGHHDPTIEFNIQKIAKLIKYTETEEMEIDCS